MKLIFHKKYLEVYAYDPAAEAGRLEPTYKMIRADKFYEIVKPKRAKAKDILRAHTEGHFDRIERSAQYEMSMLAAGGAIKTAELAYEGYPSFGLIRPPGHHASADSCWGFCFFNNMSIALLKLKSEGKINGAFILDFDLHVGDGNVNIIEDSDHFQILNPHGSTEGAYLDEVEATLKGLDEDMVDIIAVSAGFDNAVGDWGDVLSTGAYRKMGKWLKEHSEKICNGRRFAILEGGYNHELMATNLNAFCKEFGKE